MERTYIKGKRKKFVEHMLSTGEYFKHPLIYDGKIVECSYCNRQQ